MSSDIQEIASDHTSITLQWKRPVTDFDDLNFYEVRYKKSIGNKKWLSVSTNGSENTIAIHNLEENTNYDFKVRPIFEDKDGNFSYPTVTISTRPEFAVKQNKYSSMFNKANMPGRPFKIVSAENHIRVQWTPPAQTAGTIDCYELRYKDSNPFVKRWKSQWTDHDENVLTVTELQENNSYEFKVRAIFCDEDGPFSETTKLYIEKFSLGRPSPPERKSSTHCMILLKWKKPKGDCLEISHYEMRYRETRTSQKWKSLLTDGQEKHIKINDLKSSSVFECKVRAVYDDDYGPFSDTSNVATTSIDDKSVDFSTPIPTSITSNTLSLIWDPPINLNDTLDCYEVQYKQLDQGLCLAVRTDCNKNCITVMSLSCDTKYELKICAIINGKPSHFSRSVILKTLEEDNSAICLASSLHVIGVTVESVSLKWEGPIHAKYQINYYEIIYREKREDEARVKWERIHTTTNDTNITILELEPFTNYEFKVRPVFEDTFGKFNEEAITFRTQPVSNDPGVPELKESRNNQLTVHWNPPNNTTNLIYYDIRYKELNARKWLYVKVDNTEITIEDLSPDRFYEIKVKAVFDEHESHFSKTVKFSTIKLDNIYKKSELKPGIAESKSASETSLVLTWSPPKCTKVLDYFEIRYRENQTRKWNMENADRNEITLMNLKPSTKYEIKIKAIYNDDEGPYSDVGTLSTSQRKRGRRNSLQYHTGKPQSKFVSFDSIKIQWQPPSDINDLYYYDVRHKEVASERWIINPVPDKTEICFSKLKSSTRYEFKIRSVFDDGRGPFSDVTVIQTKDIDQFRKMQPEKPKSLQKTSDNICLEWTVRDIDTSLVKQYELNYRECNREEQEWTIINIDTPIATVYKLKASTLYEFKVRAIFNNCESYFSETEKVKTKSCAVEQVRQTSVTHNTMGISWDLPECHSGIQGYKVAYKERNSEWEYIKTPGKENRIMLSDLKDSGEYEIRIQSIFSNADGPYSETFKKFQTQRRPPVMIPGQPKIIESTSRSITLDWSPCELDNFDCYEIRYRECGTSKSTHWTSVVTEVKQHRFKVPDLKSGTDYEFKVAPVVDGESTQFGGISNKLNTKLSLAIRIRQNVDTLTSNGPPAQCKLPVQLITEDAASKTRKCLLKYETYFKTQEREKTGLWNWLKFQKTDKSSKSSAMDYNEKTIMLVGSTGSGKSTLIDGMINYITDVSWEDDFRFSLIDITQDEKKHSGDQTVSQTDWITTYKIPCLSGGNLDYTLNIVDTPGFGDTRGKERDTKIISQVNELFHSKNENGIQTIDGVCFVTESPLARLIPTRKYIFDIILSMFGKDIESNIFVLITFADGKTPPVLDALKTAKVPFNSSFKFNNSALFEPNTGQSKNKFAEMFWKMGEHSFKRFFNHLKTVDKKSLQLTTHVLRTRNVLEVTIEGLQRQVTDGMNQLNTIRQESEILKRLQTDIEANKNFDYEVEEVMMTEIPLEQGKYVTNCLKCNFTCHFPCGIPDDEGKKNCEAMAGTENCEICSQKCHWSKHRNAQFRIEAVNKKVQKTYQNLKEKYEVAQKEAKCQTAVLHKAKSQFIVLKKEVEDKLRKVKKCINDLNKTALKPNPLSDIEYIDLLIHSEEHELKYGWQSRVELLRLFRRKAEVISQAQSGNFSTFENYDLDESLKDFAVT